MNIVKGVDVPAIRAAIKKNPRFEEAMRILSTRERGRQDTSFRRIKRMLDEGGAKDWTIQEVEKFFKMLQAAGAGRTVFGQGRPRFVWEFHLQSVACAALGITEPKRTRKDGTVIAMSKGQMRRPTPPRAELPRLDESPVTPVTPVTPVIAMAKPGSQVITLSRAGFELKVDLATLNEQGAKRIASLIMDLKD